MRFLQGLRPSLPLWAEMQVPGEPQAHLDLARTPRLHARSEGGWLGHAYTSRRTSSEEPGDGRGPWANAGLSVVRLWGSLAPASEVVWAQHGLAAPLCVQPLPLA